MICILRISCLVHAHLHCQVMSPHTTVSAAEHVSGAGQFAAPSLNPFLLYPAPRSGHFSKTAPLREITKFSFSNCLSVSGYRKTAYGNNTTPLSITLAVTITNPKEPHVPDYDHFISTSVTAICEAQN